MAGYEFYRGSTPDFMIWEAYGVWGHVHASETAVARFTLYDPSLGRHRDIPAPPGWGESKARLRNWA